MLVQFQQFYDNYGNKVYLRNDGVLKMGVADYEMTAGIDLDFNVNDGSEINLFT